MPEGPSLVLLREEAQKFEGKIILEATGNAPIDYDRLTGRKINAIKTWGKHFLLCFDGFFVRVHMLLIGSYSIDEKHKAKVRLGLHFKNGNLFFYASQVKVFDGTVDFVYDWSADIMSKEFDVPKTLERIKKLPDAFVCDVLLDQNIFAGSGNIIKNEALFRAGVHPKSIISGMNDKKLKNVIQKVRDYAFDFLRWKKEGTLKENFQVYSKKQCPRCAGDITVAVAGKLKRKNYYCKKDQMLYMDKGEKK